MCAVKLADIVRCVTTTHVYAVRGVCFDSSKQPQPAQVSGSERSNECQTPGSAGGLTASDTDVCLGPKVSAPECSCDVRYADPNAGTGLSPKQPYSFFQTDRNTDSIRLTKLLPLANHTGAKTCPF